MKIVIAYFESVVHIVGGLEKAICDFSNAFYHRGNDVTIVVFDKKQGRPYYPLLDEIPVINLQKQNYLGVTPVEKLNREIHRLFGPASARSWKFQWKQKHGVSAFAEIVKNFQPDIIISFETMTSAEIIQEGIKVPLITSLRNDPDVCCGHLPDLERQALEKSAAVLVLMPSFVDRMKKFVKEPKVICVPNIIPQSTNQADLTREKTRYKIVNVARLNKKQKRQEILIKAFAPLAEKYPQWDIDIWGEDISEYQKELTALIKHHHLENRVFLKGVTHNIGDVYNNADIFAFPSKYEGFGQALGEAMSAGLPAIGFASCSAVNELIKDEVTGLLVEDGEDAFSHGLEILMKDKKKRIQMGQNASKWAKLYSAEKIYDKWEQVIKDCINEKDSQNQITGEKI